MILKFCAALLLSTSTIAMADQIWLPSSHTQTTHAELNAMLAAHSLVVLGEYHYDPATVAVEAQIALELGRETSTSLGWEFLNTIDNDLIEATVAKVKAGTLTADAALGVLFPNSESPLEYSALIETVTRPTLNLFATNLTRAQKTPVTQNGIGAADPALVPPDFKMGSENYFLRFKESFGDHPLPWPVENYFASQSLTDDVMAFSLLARPGAKKVLVTGSFHGDYKQGVVSRLEERSGGLAVLYIKIVNAADYSPEAIEKELLTIDPVNGPIADVVYIVEAAASKRAD